MMRKDRDTLRKDMRRLDAWLSRAGQLGLYFLSLFPARVGRFLTVAAAQVIGHRPHYMTYDRLQSAPGVFLQEFRPFAFGSIQRLKLFDA